MSILLPELALLRLGDMARVSKKRLQILEMMVWPIEFMVAALERQGINMILETLNTKLVDRKVL